MAGRDRPSDAGHAPDPAAAAAFRADVLAEYRRSGRHDLPWRLTRDPYAVLVSEVMLQQTQVPRVVPKYDEWLAEFPTLDALAAAPLEPVLRAWQGLGYNRRAVALKRTAEERRRATRRRAARRRGGAARAARDRSRDRRGRRGVRVRPARASTSRRTCAPVFLHELFADRDGVPDRELVPRRSTRSLEAADGRPADLVLRAARLRRAPQARAAQPVAPQRAPHAAVALRGLAPAEARVAAARGHGLDRACAPRTPRDLAASSRAQARGTCCRGPRSRGWPRASSRATGRLVVA